MRVQVPSAVRWMNVTRHCFLDGRRLAACGCWRDVGSAHCVTAASRRGLSLAGRCQPVPLFDGGAGCFVTLVGRARDTWSRHRFDGLWESSLRDGARSRRAPTEARLPGQWTAWRGLPRLLAPQDPRPGLQSWREEQQSGRYARSDEMAPLSHGCAQIDQICRLPTALASHAHGCTSLNPALNDATR